MSDTAVMFSGQGSQVVGMGRDLAEADPACKAVFEQANDVLGYDLATMCFEGPEDRLTQSSHAQPAIFATSIACMTALRARVPDLPFMAAAGLSSGEWTALHFAGVLSFEDTLRVLEARGRFMFEACQETPGGMLSVIGLTQDQLVPLCEEARIQIANINSPQQIVLSGKREGIDVAEEKAKEAGAKRAIRLNVSGAFHSELMAGAADRFRTFLSGIDFQTPAIPVLSNVSGEAHTTPESIRERMVEQITQSVQWVNNIQNIRKMGGNRLIECGPGKVLSGLVRRIDKEALVHNIQDQNSLEETVAALGATV